MDPSNFIGADVGINQEGSKGRLNLSELKRLSVTELSSPIELLDSDSPVSKATGLMRDRRLSECYVGEKERTAIVTLRNVLKVQNFASTKLSTIMSYIPRLNENYSVADAASMMFEHRIRSLPIYRNGKPIGKIDSHSIIERLVESRPEARVDRLMTPDPITIEERDDIGKARRVMIRRKIDQLPVTRDGKLVACVSSESIVFHLPPTTDRDSKGDVRLGRSEIPVKEFQHIDVVRSDVKDTIKKVFADMKKLQRTYSVVTTFDDEIQGIVTHRDFMKLLAEAKPTNDGVPMYMVGLPDEAFEAEAAREKFTRIVNLIRKGYPDTLEARAIIKAGETKSARKRYRVQVFLMTPRTRYNYSASGFELPDVFDEIEQWAKKLVTRYNRKPRRVRADPGSISSARQTLWTS
jgi:CBS domain-containing protein